MPAYPLTKFHVSSQEYPIDEIEARRMGNGALKKKVFFHGKKGFVLRHVHITAATKDALKAFCDTNIDADITFTWRDGVVYTCQLVSPVYKFGPYPGPGKRWDAEITLEQK